MKYFTHIILEIYIYHNKSVTGSSLTSSLSFKFNSIEKKKERDRN